MIDSHPQNPVLVLVTGPPGTGKTSLARALADELELPLLEKDTLKETIGEALGITERAESHRLGAGSFEAMALIAHDLLRRRCSVIVEGNFRPESTLVRDLPPCRLVQVHVWAAPEAIRDRLTARGAHRHPVHYDGAAAAEIAERARAGEWDALAIGGELISVDTTEAFPDIGLLSRSVSG